MNSKLILMLILIIAVFASGCVKIEDGSQIETMPSQIEETRGGDGGETYPDSDLDESIEEEKPKSETKNTGTELLPKTSALGDDIKRTGRYVFNDETLNRCPQDETGRYGMKTPLDTADYGILVKKCRTEQESIDHFEHKTSSHSFSEISGYGSAAKTSGKSIKFRYGIYYVDVAGMNEEAKLSIIKRFAEVTSDHVKKLSE